MCDLMGYAKNEMRLGKDILLALDLVKDNWRVKVRWGYTQYISPIEKTNEYPIVVGCGVRLHPRQLRPAKPNRE